MTITNEDLKKTYSPMNAEIQRRIAYFLNHSGLNFMFGCGINPTVLEKLGRHSCHESWVESKSGEDLYINILTRYVDYVAPGKGGKRSIPSSLSVYSFSRAKELIHMHVEPKTLEEDVDSFIEALRKELGL